MAEGEARIRGWGCTPTGEVPAAAVTSSRNEQPPGCLPAQMTRGWRRSTLYLILALLMLTIFINLALTLWIIATLRLSMNSVGPIKIVKGGIELQGQAYFTDHLIASTIFSPMGQPIALQSYRNFSVFVRDPDEDQQSKFVIKRDVIECGGRAFEVSDGRGQVLFSVAREAVRVAADSLVVEGVGGVTVKNSVQTPLVRAPPGADLELESQTRSLDLRAPQSIFVESRAGSIDISSHKDIKLDSIVGAIKIDAPNIILKNLKQATATDKPISSKTRGIKTKVYQICACVTGKLFLAAPDVLCNTHVDDTDLCR